MRSSMQFQQTRMALEWIDIAVSRTQTTHALITTISTIQRQKHVRIIISLSAWRRDFGALLSRWVLVCRYNDSPYAISTILFIR